MSTTFRPRFLLNITSWTPAAVRRITLLDDTVEKQAGLAGGQADLVAEIGFAPVLDDDVRVLLEDGDHLFVDRNRLAQHDPALGRADGHPGQVRVVHQTSQYRNSPLSFPRPSPG